MAAPIRYPVENIWQHLRETWLSNRVFETYEAIIEAASGEGHEQYQGPSFVTHGASVLGAELIPWCWEDPRHASSDHGSNGLCS